MGLLILLLLDSWPVSQGRALLEELHSYDILACEVRATPLPAGLDVDCRMRLRVLRPGPLRFFLSRDVEGLSVRCAGEEVPAVDFKNHLVLFSRNTQFFNRISIFKVEVTKGVAQVLSMETRSARPIEDKVAMSLVLVVQEGISSLQSGEITIPIVKKH